jgi:hypothetical protein
VRERERFFAAIASFSRAICSARAAGAGRKELNLLSYFWCTYGISSWYHSMLHLKAFSCNSFAVEEEEEEEEKEEEKEELDFLSFCVPIASSWYHPMLHLQALDWKISYHPMLHLQALDWNISFAVDVGGGGGGGGGGGQGEDRIRKSQPALKP